MSPIWFVLLGIIVYALAGFYYGKSYNRNVWKPDPTRETPAHKYMDGVSFFPTPKSVLYGFEFQSIAGLGPVFGPFIALFFGWLPALIWILLGNFFIGWIHDYSTTFVSTRSDGKSLGPLLHENISPRARGWMLGFLFFYLLLITAVFLLLISLFLSLYPTSVFPTIALIVGGTVLGYMLYTARVKVTWSTLIGLLILAVGVIIGILIPLPKVSFVTWLIIICIGFWIASQAPMAEFTQPTIYLSTYYALFGMALVFIGAFLAPLFGIPIKTPAWGGFFGFTKAFWNPGPIWPLLMVSIACGAISGWHCIVTTCGTSRNVDVETDILPVSGGAMLTEGLLALAALTLFMVIPGAEALKLLKWGAVVEGAKVLISPWLGGAAAIPFLNTFFPAFLIFFALTLTLLLVRFYTYLMRGLLGGGSSSSSSSSLLRILLTNKYVAPATLLIIAGLFAWSGAWINLWLLFGGSNQCLAGIGLILATVYLAKAKRPTKYTLYPAIFMIATTVAALLWEGTKFVLAGISGAMGGKTLLSGIFAISGPIVKGPLGNFPAIASGFNFVFGIIGYILCIIALVVAYDSFKAYKSTVTA